MTGRPSPLPCLGPGSFCRVEHSMRRAEVDHAERLLSSPPSRAAFFLIGGASANAPLQLSWPRPKDSRKDQWAKSCPLRILQGALGPACNACGVTVNWGWRRASCRETPADVTDRPAAALAWPDPCEEARKRARRLLARGSCFCWAGRSCTF